MLKLITINKVAVKYEMVEDGIWVGEILDEYLDTILEQTNSKLKLSLEIEKMNAILKRYNCTEITIKDCTIRVKSIQGADENFAYCSLVVGVLN